MYSTTLSQDLLDVRKQREVFVSAQDVGDFAGVEKAQVLYWGRAGFLPRRAAGYHQYPLSAVPKTKLMGLLTNEIGLEAARASQLADSLLGWIKERPQAVDALLTFLRALYVNFEEVMTHLDKSGFGKELLQLGLSGSAETEEESTECVP
jgi:hypothetical protein